MTMTVCAPPRPFRRVPFRQIGHHRMREREVDVEEDPAGMGKAIPLTRLDAAHLIRLPQQVGQPPRPQRQGVIVHAEDMRHGITIGPRRRSDHPIQRPPIRLRPMRQIGRGIEQPDLMGHVLGELRDGISREIGEGALFRTRNQDGDVRSHVSLPGGRPRKVAGIVTPSSRINRKKWLRLRPSARAAADRFPWERMRARVTMARLASAICRSYWLVISPTRFGRPRGSESQRAARSCLPLHEIENPRARLAVIEAEEALDIRAPGAPVYPRERREIIKIPDGALPSDPGHQPGPVLHPRAGFVLLLMAWVLAEVRVGEMDAELGHAREGRLKRRPRLEVDDVGGGPDQARSTVGPESTIRDDAIRTTGEPGWIIILLSRLDDELGIEAMRKASEGFHECPIPDPAIPRAPPQTGVLGELEGHQDDDRPRYGLSDRLTAQRIDHGRAGDRVS